MNTAWQLHFIAICVVFFTLSAEAYYLFAGSQITIPDVLLGRILGTFDSSLVLVLGYYFSASLRPVGMPSSRASDKPTETK